MVTSMPFLLLLTIWIAIESIQWNSCNATHVLLLHSNVNYAAAAIVVIVSHIFSPFDRISSSILRHEITQIDKTTKFEHIYYIVKCLQLISFYVFPRRWLLHFWVFFSSVVILFSARFYTIYSILEINKSIQSRWNVMCIISKWECK